MNELVPITWLISKIVGLVETGASVAATNIANTITPLVSICFGIYMILIAFNYLRGAESEPILDFGMRCIGFAIVIGMGLNASNYSNYVIPIVTGLGESLANGISGGAVSEGMLDKLALKYIKIIARGFKSASGLTDNIAMFLKAAVVLIGLVPFLVIAALAIVVAKIGSLLVAMVGPIFFGFLLFPSTRQYFSAWVSTALSYSLIPTFVAVVALMSVSLSDEMLGANVDLNEATFILVILASIGNLLLLLLLNQVSSLASSLSAGGINASLPGSGTVGSAAKMAVGSAVAGGKAAKMGYQGAKAAGQWAANKFGKGNNISNADKPPRKAG